MKVKQKVKKVNKVIVNMESGDSRTFYSSLSVPQIMEDNGIGNQYFYYHWNGYVANPMIGVISSVTVC